MELCQAVHHAVLFEKYFCLHAVVNTKQLLLCTNFNFSAKLLKAHQTTIVLLYDQVLTPFCARSRQIISQGLMILWHLSNMQ